MGYIIFTIIFLSIAITVWKFKPIRYSPHDYSSPPIPLGIANKAATVLAAILAGVVFLTGLLYVADAEKIYVAQWVEGTLRTVTTPGPKLKLFGKVTEYDRVLALGTPQFKGEADDTDSDDAREADRSHILTLQIDSPLVRFTDKAKANMYGLIRVAMPLDREGILQVHRDFGSSEALASNLLAGSFRSSALASARLMTIQEYIGKSGNDYEEAFGDQLEHGLYLTKAIEETEAGPAPSTADTPTPEGQAIAQTSPGGEVSSKGEQIIEVVKVVDDSTGEVARQGKLDFEEYNLRLVTARVEYIHPESQVRTQIGSQRTTEANAALAEKRRRTAIIEAEAERAEGQKNVAMAQAKELETQMTQTIAAETEKKKNVIQAQQRLEVAELRKAEAKELLAASKDEAAAIKIRAEAEAYQKKAVMAADNALEAKLAAWVESQKFWADSHSKRAVPAMVLGGGDGEGMVGGNFDTQTFMAVLTANLARQLDLDMGVAKK